MLHKNLLAVILLLVLVVLAIVIFLRSDKGYKIPDSIRKHLTFNVLYPTQPVDGWSLKPNTTTFSLQENRQDSTFSFLLVSGKQTITMSEQAYPEALVYDNLVNGIRPYDSVGTIYGTLTLARPQYLNGAQAVVANYNSQTLVFGKPSQDVSKQQWHDIINSLEPAK